MLRIFLFCFFCYYLTHTSHAEEGVVVTKKKVKDPNTEAANGYRKFPVIYDEKADMVYSYEARVRSYEDIMNNVPVNQATDPLSMSNIELLIDTNDYNGLTDLLTQNQGVINNIQENGVTPLHYAVSRNSKAMVDIILLSGFDINKADKNGEVFLLNLFKGQSVGTDILQLLISKVTDIDAQDNKGNTLSTLAIERNDTTLLDAVMKKGANPNYKHPSRGYLIQMAIQNVDYNIVKTLLENNANPNVKIQMYNSYNSNKQTIGLIDSVMNPLMIVMHDNRRSLFALILPYVLKTNDPERKESLQDALAYAIKIGDEDYKTDLGNVIKNLE